MTRTWRLFLGSLVFGLSAVGTATAQPASEDATKGAVVTISGCVATDDKKSFVLTNVEEIAGPRSTVPATTTKAMAGVEGGGSGIIYWLSDESVKLMRGHFGHRVEVTGTITDVSTGTLKVKQEPGKTGPDNKMVVDAGGKEAKLETDRPVRPGLAPGTKSEQKEILPLRRVKVDTVKMVSATCS